MAALGLAADQDDVAAEDFLELSRLHGCFVSDQDLVASEDFVVESIVHVPARVLDFTPQAPQLPPVTALAKVQQHAAKAQRHARSSVQKIRRQAVIISDLRSQLERCSASRSSASSGSKRQTRAHTMFMLALRRNRGHAGAAVALGMTDAPVSCGGTLTRWEVSASTCFLSSFLLFHIVFENTVVRTSGTNGWSAAFHSLRGDATRSRAWQEHKVQCLELTTAYLSSTGDLVSRSGWLDLQKVTDGSADGCFDVMRKQIRVVGCPALDHDHAVTPEGVVRWIVCVGDCGPDQVGVRERITTMYVRDLYVLVAIGPCFSHQQSLGVKRILVAIDKLTKPGGLFELAHPYYSTVAKLVNVWRTKTTEATRVILNSFGADRAKQTNAHTKPPKACAGRWGSVTHAEMFLEKFEPAEIATVIRSVHGRKKSSQQSASCVVIDEVAIDDMKDYAEKQSRWVGEILSTLNARFYAMMFISRVAKKPWDHFLNFLQSKVEDGTHLSVLVGGKAAAIGNEFCDCYLNADASPFVTRLDAPDVAKFHASFATCVGSAAAEFDRRITRRFVSYPLKLLMFVLKPHGMMCGARKGAAIELLDCDYSNLDSTTAKFKYIFVKEIKYVAETSLCDPHFHKMLSTWRDMYWSDIQVVESVNSIITNVTGVAPRIELALLSSRITIKKALKDAGDGGSHGNDFRDKAALLQCMDTCANSYRHAEYNAITDIDNRWLDTRCPGPMLQPLCDADMAMTLVPLEDFQQRAVTVPVNSPEDDDGPDQAAGVDDGPDQADGGRGRPPVWQRWMRPDVCGLPPDISTHHMEGSHQLSTLLTRRMRSADATEAFAIVPRGQTEPNSNAWLCLSVLSYTGHGQQLSVEADGAISMTVPFKFENTAWVVARAWRDDPSCDIIVLRLEWQGRVALSKFIEVIRPQKRPQAQKRQSAAAPVKKQRRTVKNKKDLSLKL